MTECMCCIATGRFTIHSNCNVVLLYYFSLNGVICDIVGTFSSTKKSLGASL